MKKTLKTAKNKVIVKKQGSKIVNKESKEDVMSEESLKERLGEHFGSVESTGFRKKNKFMAVSKDKKNRAYGHTAIEALSNLIKGISARGLN